MALRNRTTEPITRLEPTQAGVGVNQFAFDFNPDQSHEIAMRRLTIPRNAASARGAPTQLRRIDARQTNSPDIAAPQGVAVNSDRRDAEKCERHALALLRL